MSGTREQGASWEPLAAPTQSPRPRLAPDKRRLFKEQRVQARSLVLGPSEGWESCLGILARGRQGRVRHLVEECVRLALGGAG